MSDSSLSWFLVGGIFVSASALLPTTARALSCPQQSAAAPEVIPPANADGLAPIADGASSRDCELNLPSCQQQGSEERMLDRCKARAQAKYWGYPEEFLDAPLGAMVNSHVATSIAKGRAARMSLYQYDFYPGSDKLKPRGRAQVAKFAAWMSMHPMPMFVEPSGNSPQLDDARRQAVLRELENGTCPVPAELVLVGYSASRGLEGLEALAVDRNRMSQTLARGSSAGSAVGLSASSGAGSGGSR